MKTAFRLLAALMFWAPVIYAVSVHQWWVVGAIFLAGLGVAIEVAVKDVKV